MIVKQCIAADCTDFSVDKTQLCETHLAEHIKKCKFIMTHDKKKTK